ncbi:unnamed protein product [Trifolium pratense]|uniref:Uncharacterized protein n=1 Tax=Trifolium pratense TaxID=57577 RepID=A0ACB0KLM6_TRIPR|nr:unnamed protein product [Trifolium pratense]
MAQAIRNAKVPPNSVNLEEARQRVFGFFRIACRSLPTVMEVYNLYDVATISQLRSTIASEIRRNDHITNPKGLEELKNVVNHSKQRHHIVGQYVIGRRGLEQQELASKEQGISNFLKDFYNSNYS